MESGLDSGFAGVRESTRSVFFRLPPSFPTSYPHLPFQRLLFLLILNTLKRVFWSALGRKHLFGICSREHFSSSLHIVHLCKWKQKCFFLLLLNTDCVRRRNISDFLLSKILLKLLIFSNVNTMWRGKFNKDGWYVCFEVSPFRSETNGKPP